MEESGATLSVDELPTVEADGDQLVRVFENLVGNALKFRSDQPLHIQIGAGHDGTGWRFSVIDNGIGIAPQYRQRVFELFKRLHSQQDYPGTGIGLAICSLIVERHGGRIWVDDAPGGGSAFHFTMAGRAQTRR